MTLMPLAVAAAATLAIVTLLWRYASSRFTLPCPSWLGWLIEIENPFAPANRASSVVQSLNLQSGHGVLDAGCGPGRITIPLARALSPHGHVVALDLQESMLATVRTKARRLGLTNITTRQSPLGAGRLPTAEFDRAVVSAVLGEVPGRQDAVNELFAAVKPGGLLAVAELVFDPHFLPRHTVRQLALNAGFLEDAAHGNRFAYVLVFRRPAQGTSLNQPRPASLQ